MKHVRLFQTTQAMQSELANIPKPFIAVAEDALGNPVIQGPVTTPSLYKIYLKKYTGLHGIDESFKESETYGLFIGGVHAYYNHISGEIGEQEDSLEITPCSGVEFNGDTLEADGYIEVPAGTVIKYRLEYSAASNFEVKVLNLEDTTLNYQTPTTLYNEGNESDVLLEYTVNSDTYLYLAGDFS